MLHVLRHYLPFRKALLIVSETILLTACVLAVMSTHLVRPDEELIYQLAFVGLDSQEAFLRSVVSALLAAVLAQVAISFNELYDFRISDSRYDRAARFLGSAGSGILLVALVLTLARVFVGRQVLDFPGLPFTQTIVLLSASLGLGFGLLYLWRNVFHRFMRHSTFNQRLLVLGSGRLADRLIEELGTRKDAGFEVAAVLAPNPAARGERRRSDGDRRAEDRRGSAEERREGRSGTGNPWFDAGVEHSRAAGPTALGSTGPRGPRLLAREDPSTTVGSAALRSRPEKSSQAEGEEALHELAQRLDVSDIVVALQDRRGSFPTDELLHCRMNGVVIHEAEAFFEQLTGKIPAEAMRPSYLIFNRGFRQNPLAQIAKRVFDLMLGVVVFLLTWPLMIFAALAVRFDSPGPILFRQERTGQNGKSFTLMKFRSMRQDAEKKTGPVWASTNDPRITRVGRFLRKTRIDELPQLFNVFAGSMSFVGPRPERPNFVADLTEKIPYYSQRHIVKPGLTGWAQINYPYGNTVEDALQKLQFDLFYIKYRSVLFDFSIVLNTIKTVVLRKGT